MEKGINNSKKKEICTAGGSKNGGKTGKQKNFVDTTTRIISYDFRTGKYVYPLKRVKVHTPVVFEVRNINPFAYKVTLTPKDSILAASSFDKELLQIIAKWDIQEAEGKLATSQNDLSKNIASQTSSLIAGDFKESKADGKVKATAQQNQKAFNIVNELLKLDEKIRDEKGRQDSIAVLSDLDSLVLHEKGANGFRILDSVNAQRLKGILDTLIAEERQELLTATDSVAVKDARKHLEVIKGKLNEWTNLEHKIKKDSTRKDSLEKQMNESVKSYYLLANDFYAKYDDFMADSRHVFMMLRYAKAINTMADNPQLSYTLFKRQYEQELKQYVFKLFKSVTTIDNYKRSYSELTNSYFKVIYSPLLDDFMSPSGISKAQAYPQFLKMKSDQLADWLAKYPVENLLRQAQWVLSVLQDSSRYSVRSIPIQPENDLLEFHAHIKKRGDGISDAHHSERNFVYRQPTFGGTRVDFSLGLAASYYWGVNTYELDTVSKIAESDADGIAVPSIVGMVTMSRRKTGYLAYGASAGIGIGVDNGKIQLGNFYIGPTILLGKRERIFVSLGPSLRNVKQLRASAPVGTIVPNTSDLSSFMKDRYKVGVFASITYSLTKDAKSMIRNIW
ncbi:hypothetical protein [Parapedobacter sp. DT-150]|uniref:hypothetical protein n=1 Tax=Parapedobacter sp. DT-150 TaxID=3396162 RepID=UPI003F1BB3F9